MRETTVRCHEAHDDEFLILPRSPDKSFVLLETFREMHAGLYLFICLTLIRVVGQSFSRSVHWVVTDRGERANVRQ